MKNAGSGIGFALIALLIGGGLGYFVGQQTATFSPDDPQFQLAAKAGQQATIVQVVEQAFNNPCQTINLYNKADANNPKEVNLINITCEGLNLPDINDVETIEE